MSTGIVRRIDELGRIVIPKEIRKNLGLREGEGLEISVEDNQLVMKKYSKIDNYQDNIKSIIKFISDSFNININFYDERRYINQSELLEIDKFMNFITMCENIVKIMTKYWDKFLIDGVSYTLALSAITVSCGAITNVSPFVSAYRSAPAAEAEP